MSKNRTRNFNANPSYMQTCNSVQQDDGRQYDDRLIEGITVSVNYWDFLQESLRENLAHFDRFVVVTHFDDINTQQICEQFSVECVKTDLFFERGDRFNKGAALNLGLAYLRQNGWILCLDADICLPDRFRNMLDKTCLDRESIYGAARVNVPGWDAWREHKRVRQPQFHHRFMVDSPDEFHIGSTLVHKEWGYCPIGYFQLWHASKKVRYPSVKGSAEHDDVLHAAQWPRHKRHLLPTVRVFHLESERAKMGANWSGRKTRQFGPGGPA